MFKLAKAILISPGFFDLDRQIMGALRQEYADVDMYYERPQSVFLKSLVRLRIPFVTSLVCSFYYFPVFTHFRRSSKSFVLIVNPECMPVWFLKSISKRHRVCIYLWDSLKIKRQPLKYFLDGVHVFSFDKNDSIEHGLVFLPLFIPSSFGSTASEGVDISVSFAGTVHGNRLSLLDKIDTYCEQNQMSCFLHLYVPTFAHKIWFTVVCLVKGYDLKISRRGLVRKKYDSVVNKSDCVIDFVYKGQNGLSMRTFEVLAKGKKLVTNNFQIIEYDFYDPHMIMVTDFQDLGKLSEFINESGGVRLDMSGYTLENWLKTIINYGD